MVEKRESTIRDRVDMTRLSWAMWKMRGNEKQREEPGAAAGGQRYKTERVNKMSGLHRD